MAQRRYTTLSAGKVFGLESGRVEDATCICLLLHGRNIDTQSSEVWRNLLAPLAEEGSYYLFALDMPGYGSSPALPEVKDSLSDHKNQEHCLKVIEELFDIFSSQNTKNARKVLIGKSWGGALALEYTIKYPKQLSGLILSAPAYWQIQENYETKKTAESRFANISVPMLIAWSTDDKIIPYEPSSNRYIKLNPNAHLILYTQGNHDAAAHNALDFAPRAHIFISKLLP